MYTGGVEGQIGFKWVVITLVACVLLGLWARDMQPEESADYWDDRVADEQRSALDY